MPGGYIIEGGKRLVVVSPSLPNGCSECTEAILCTEPVREAFREVKQLPEVKMAGKNKVTLPTEVQYDEPHKTVLTNFDVVSSAMRNLLESCGESAVDVYNNGEYVGLECGSTGRIVIN
jgi:hypothetical protein